MLSRYRASFAAVLIITFLSSLTAGEGAETTSVTETDVVIIGGGSAGTYAAIGLLDQGINVVVVEKQSDLGGHADTYTDPSTGQSVNAGVQIFHDTAIVKDYASRLGVPMTPPSFGGNTTTLSIDFTSGKSVVNPTSDPGLTNALAKYISIYNATYPDLNRGFFLPDPVPEDLTIPFGDFAKKYQIEPVVFLFNQYTQGWDISRVPTVYALLVVNLDLARDIQAGTFLTTHDTNDLYRSAAAILGPRVIYNASVISVVRSKAGVSVRVEQQGKGARTLRASKLLMTGSPVLENLQGWDLVPAEKTLFAKFRGYGYFAGAVSNPDLPEDTSFLNVAVNNSGFNTPRLPAIFALSDTPLPNKTRLVYYGTQPDIDHKVAALICLNDIDSLVHKLGYGHAKTKLLAWYPHGPFNIGVGPDDIRKGFYAKLYALQGQRNTYWSGSTWQAQDSTQIWTYTKTLIDIVSQVK
ncbi:FAD/NAD(P)-binding domain-containing protein [Coniochaeta sp. PMI_546]|nr:FAD/NAD(P)-binding domain-containing protein [Coniochaeta sp. PMI_546]